jgi:hypothetical protein
VVGAERACRCAMLGRRCSKMAVARLRNRSSIVLVDAYIADP